MNSDAPSVLRTWPIRENWAVILNRSFDGTLVCGMITGYRDDSREELYFWGVRQGAKSAGLFIADRNSTAVAGDAIAVSIDGLKVGTYRVTDRHNDETATRVIAEISKQDLARVVHLMAVGGKVQFSLMNSNYAASLGGIQLALRDNAQCYEEVVAISSPPP